MKKKNGMCLWSLDMMDWLQKQRGLLKCYINVADLMIILTTGVGKKMFWPYLLLINMTKNIYNA